MADFTHVNRRLYRRGSDRKEGKPENPVIEERAGSKLGCISMLEKTQEFFQTCDIESKGYITRIDMRVSKLSLILFVQPDIGHYQFISLHLQVSQYLSLVILDHLGGVSNWTLGLPDHTQHRCSYPSHLVVALYICLACQHITSCC